MIQAKKMIVMPYLTISDFNFRRPVHVVSKAEVEEEVERVKRLKRATEIPVFVT